MKLSTLEDYTDLTKKVELWREYLVALQSAVERTTAIITLTPRGQGKNKNRLESYMARMEEAAAALNQSILDMESQRRMIEDWADGLMPGEREVIRAKYLSLKRVSWASAAYQTGYSVEGAYRIRRKLIERGELEE